MANDLEVGRNVLQDLGYILAEAAQLVAATGATVLPWKVCDDLAGKMRGQRPARGLGLGLGLGHFYACFSGGLRGLQFFQVKFELLNLDGDLLTPGPEHHALQLLDDHAQTLDLMALRGERFEVCQGCLLTLPVLLDNQRLQRCNIESIEIWQNSGNHGRSMPHKR
jgi:hypothetical protein